MSTDKEEEYSNHIEVVRVIKTDLSIVEVFDEFFKVVWLGGGGLGKAKIIDQGDEETGVGLIRLVGYTVKEKILKLDKENYEDIIEMQYSVIAGPFPVSNHLGTIKFTKNEQEEKGIKIVWAVDYTPLALSNLIVKGLVQSTFPIFLNSLQKSLDKELPEEEEQESKEIVYTDKEEVIKVVPGSCKDVYNKWFDCVWKKGKK